jgi:hypothetical protein
VPTLQPFAPWQDVADYILAPSGNIEGGTARWQLAGGAAAVEGNEPYRVGGAADHTALALPAASRATTASMCIGVEHRTMRFFARGTPSSSLDVEVLYRKKNAGPQKSVRLGAVAGRGTWAPTDILPMIVNVLAAETGNAMDVNLRFTPRSGSWTIDDVYVDPYRKG